MIAGALRRGVANQAAPRGRGPMLIVADDSAEIRDLVRSTLAETVGEIDEAKDGRDLSWKLSVWSMKRCEGDAPLLVIADVSMPFYNGLEVLEAWREVESNICCIVIAGFPETDLRDRVERMGGILLSKPFSQNELRGAVAYFLR